LKILYAIQGTGNGHLARAIDVFPALCTFGTVDVLVSGIQGDIQFPFPVKYKLYGMSFIFGKNGGVDKWSTVKKMKLIRLFKDIAKLPVKEYDLIINDFEAVSAWACRWHKMPCISLSHQSAVLHPSAPKPVKYDLLGDLILKYYAPTTHQFGFHFKAFDDNIFTPIIRQQVRDLIIAQEDYYTVYLPSYDDNAIIKTLHTLKSVNWQVFSKHTKEAYTYKNIHIQPIENNAFLQSMASCTGVLCGGGFETPSEALFLGKKLLVIPMQGQYEQQCNAAFLASMGVPVIDSLHKKNMNKIAEWIDDSEVISVSYPDNVLDAVTKVVEFHWSQSSVEKTIAQP
jgi:uncharacterized protein (TIGR00661 family)